MSLGYSVNVDPEQVKDAVSLFEFVGGNSDEALRVAINRTLPKARTKGSSTIREQVRLPLSYVNDRLLKIKATRRTLSGKISALSRGLLLSRYSTDPIVASDRTWWIRPPLVPPRGIRVKIKPTGAAQAAPSIGANRPFYIVLNKGANVGIAARVAATGRKVKVFSGPSLSQVWAGVREDITPDAASMLQGELLDAMRYLLVKQYPQE